MERIQIAVDDFGISRAANERILALVLAKKVHRVAIMAYGKISPEERQALLSSGVRTDIHLDMAGDIPQDRKLKENITGRVVAFLWHFFSGTYTQGHIEQLWEAQIMKFHELFGRFPDGLNTHQHTHFFPPLFHILLGLSQKYGIPYIRFGKQSVKKWNGVAIILDCLRMCNRETFRRSGCQTSDVLISADWVSDFGRSRQEKGWSADTSVEVIFHPEREEEFLCVQEGRGIFFEKV